MTNSEKESKRVEALEKLNILDTITETDYDNITYLASVICQAPIALISFVDRERQWFKSAHGLTVKETPRKYSFCSHAIDCTEEVVIIEDSRNDDRFKNNPLSAYYPDTVFYAGVPLISHDGYGLGTVCIIDNKTRLLTEEQKTALKMLSRNVMNLLELRQKNLELEAVKIHLENRNEDLESFAMVVTHDIKSPLTNILLSHDLLLNSDKASLPAETRELIKFSNNAAKKLKLLVEGILSYYKNENDASSYKSILLSDYFDSLKSSIQPEEGMNIKLDIKHPEKCIYFNRTKLDQIFLNLVNNSIRYNDKEEIRIEIGHYEDSQFYHFYVKDNGPGIPEKDYDSIFNLFKTASHKDRFGVKGSGIGLPTVKKIIESTGGSIDVESHLGEGTTFSFSIKKLPFN
ncbi:GAF domain-containing sensor histidine kinase [Fulvivirga maritima]|uniref:sensor histidine kinase n=1 Tax=Fulvivirga maritima TaxID=2904247 RepID=UPI001F38BAC0|nr:GAF domain-containing sensor histidine kinase [Fulvivirga maritima]UII26378.1 GAF domain-containing sensor histidine kinase [Fulvivirga maritima]